MKSTIQQWNRLHSIFMLLGLFIIIETGSIGLLPAILTISIVLLILGNRNQKHIWSYANMVTLFRLGLILYASWNITWLENETLFILFSVALTLDGVDGYLARKYNQSSELGGYLDMETDSFFVAFLAIWWWQNDLAGFWLLLIGFMRYIYVLVIIAFRIHHKKEKSTRFAKTIAVIFMMGILGPFILPDEYSYWLLVLITILTAYSFGVSFWSRIVDK